MQKLSDRLVAIVAFITLTLLCGCGAGGTTGNQAAPRAGDILQAPSVATKTASAERDASPSPSQAVFGEVRLDHYVDADVQVETLDGRPLATVTASGGIFEVEGPLPDAFRVVAAVRPDTKPVSPAEQALLARGAPTLRAEVRGWSGDRHIQVNPVTTLVACYAARYQAEPARAELLVKQTLGLPSDADLSTGYGDLSNSRFTVDTWIGTCKRPWDEWMAGEVDRVHVSLAGNEPPLIPWTGKWLATTVGKTVLTNLANHLKDIGVGWLYDQLGMETEMGRVIAQLEEINNKIEQLKEDVHNLHSDVSRWITELINDESYSQFLMERRVTQDQIQFDTEALQDNMHSPLTGSDLYDARRKLLENEVRRTRLHNLLLNNDDPMMPQGLFSLLKTHFHIDGPKPVRCDAKRAALRSLLDTTGGWEAQAMALTIEGYHLPATDGGEPDLFSAWNMYQRTMDGLAEERSKLPAPLGNNDIVMMTGNAYESSLMYTRDVFAPMKPADALQFADSKAIGRYRGWRLPTESELRNIIADRRPERFDERSIVYSPDFFDYDRGGNQWMLFMPPWHPGLYDGLSGYNVMSDRDKIVTRVDGNQKYPFILVRDVLESDPASVGLPANLTTRIETLPDGTQRIRVNLVTRVTFDHGNRYVYKYDQIDVTDDAYFQVVNSRDGRVSNAFEGAGTVSFINDRPLTVKIRYGNNEVTLTVNRRGEKLLTQPATILALPMQVDLRRAATATLSLRSFDGRGIRVDHDPALGGAAWSSSDASVKVENGVLTRTASTPTTDVVTVTAKVGDREAQVSVRVK